MEKKLACLEKKSEGEKEVEVLLEDEEEEEEVVLPGFRFHPTDEELVGFYLRRKVDNKPISIEIIKQIDIYKYDPWDLPSKLYQLVCMLLLLITCHNSRIGC